MQSCITVIYARLVYPNDRPTGRLTVEIMVAVSAYRCPTHALTVIFPTVVIVDRTYEVALRSLTIETFFEYSVRVLQASSFEFKDKFAALSFIRPW